MNEFSERILKGRNAEKRLNDPVLNEAMDKIIEKWMRGIIAAPPSQYDEILEAKRRIDAVQELRSTLKMWVEDGQMALAQQEEENNE